MTVPDDDWGAVEREFDRLDADQAEIRETAWILGILAAAAVAMFVLAYWLKS